MHYAEVITMYCTHKHQEDIILLLKNYLTQLEIAFERIHLSFNAVKSNYIFTRYKQIENKRHSYIIQ